MSHDAGERTFEPTEHRKEEFRKKGRFAKARDAGGIVATAAVLVFAAGSEARIAESARRLFERTLGDLGALGRLGPAAIVEITGRELAAVSGAAVVAAACLSAIAALAQARFRTYTELLSPDLSRLDPRQGMTRLFSPKRAGGELFVAILRVGAVGGVAWYALLEQVPMLSSLGRMPLDAALEGMFGALGRTAAAATGALVLVAVIDYAQSFFTIARDMKMTRKEREDETRQSDGDPKAKARMKARARATAKRRAMTAVKNADVVVTNPTHVAVALRYGPRDPAPVVIAKGHDEVALRIRAEARKHGIPILENRPLARALDAQVSLGRPVPAAHFAAVARVLAFVYQLRDERRRR